MSIEGPTESDCKECSLQSLRGSVPCLGTLVLSARIRVLDSRQDPLSLDPEQWDSLAKHPQTPLWLDRGDAAHTMLACGVNSRGIRDEPHGGLLRAFAIRSALAGARRWNKAGDRGIARFALAHRIQAWGQNGTAFVNEEAGPHLYAAVEAGEHKARKRQGLPPVPETGGEYVFSSHGYVDVTEWQLPDLCESDPCSDGAVLEYSAGRLANGVAYQALGSTSVVDAEHWRSTGEVRTLPGPEVPMADIIDQLGVARGTT